ncbi:MAG: recombination protein RecR [Desulfovibrionales bacterium]|nr:recombination protein RecR [Desulfovibrionales bacterium]
MQRLPAPLQKIVSQFSALPGVGPKSALRMALTLLKWQPESVRALGQNIAGLRDALHICSRCGSLADADPCHLCTDPTRTRELLCLVAEWDSLMVMEEAGLYKGRYLILGGLLSPLDGVEASALEMPRLTAILREAEVQEVILALGSTMEAEATSTYIHTFIGRDFPQVRVTRLAQGIPLGAELKYVDRETLKQSLKYRHSLEAN